MLKMKTIAIAAVAALMAGSASAAEKVTYLFPAPDFLPAFAPFQLAKAKGYYTAEGIDIKFEIGKGGADVAKQVAVGNAELGGGIGDTPLIVRANGLPVKAVALLGGQSLTAIIARKDRNIHSFKDLKGKKIGVMSFQDTTYYNLLAVLASAGLKKDDASIQAVGPAGVIQLLSAGSLDAISGVPEWVVAVQAHTPVEVMQIDSVFPAMAQAILASDDIIKKRPKAVEGVVKATLKAVKDIMDDPAKAAKEYCAAMPQHKGKEAQIEAILRRYVKDVYALKPGEKLGRFDAKRMAAVQKFYVDNGIVEKAVPIAETYTNEFVK
jgi:NitT/TauT family transport system substrate-binding protein